MAPRGNVVFIEFFAKNVSASAAMLAFASALVVLPAAAGTNSWTAIGPVAYPFAFAVDPSSPSTIYSVVNGNTVTKTTDGGGHWADLAVLAPDQVNSLVIDPRSPATIYAALGDPWDLADVPIYKSIDGGRIGRRRRLSSTAGPLQWWPLRHR